MFITQSKNEKNEKFKRRFLLLKTGKLNLGCIKPKENFSYFKYSAKRKLKPLSNVVILSPSIQRPVLYSLERKSISIKTEFTRLLPGQQSDRSSHGLPAPAPLTAATVNPHRAPALASDATLTHADAKDQDGLAGLKHSAQEVEDRDSGDDHLTPAEKHFPARNSRKFTKLNISNTAASHSQSLPQGWIKSNAIFHFPYLRVSVDDGRVDLFRNKHKLMMMLTHYALSSLSLASRNSGQIKPVIWHNCPKNQGKEKLKKQRNKVIFIVKHLACTFQPIPMSVKL